MKLSALFMSINIAATMPVAVYASNTADGNVKTNSDWLKACIAQPDNRQSTTKLSVSTDIELPKIRPFNAHRKLPHKKDLEAALAAQTPQMASVAPSSLNGGVSTDVAAQASAYFDSFGKNFQTQASTTSRRRVASARTTQSTYKGQANATPKSPLQYANEWMARAQQQTTASQPSSTGTQFRKLQMNEGMLNAINPENLPGGGSSDEELAVEENANKRSNLGPPPFPLNLLPEDQLKQIISTSGARPQIDAPRQSFGSWRSGGQSGLAPAGFHTYLASRTVPVSRYGSYAPRTYVAYNRTAQTSKSKSKSKTVAQHKASTSQPINVAVYPAYTSPWSTITY